MVRGILPISILIFIVFLGCDTKSCINSIKPSADSGMVVSAHPIASKIGLEILKNGGNAVDAAAAVHFALAVCYPAAGNLGGGGFMLIRMDNGDKQAIDYREAAPDKASRDMFLDKKGQAIAKMSLSTHLASGVPGSVDGVLKAHAQYGKLSLKRVIQPAIDIARFGFKITKRQANDFNGIQQELSRLNSKPTAFQKSTPWKSGDLLVQSELARTLELIRDYGRSGFYEGETALKIQNEMQRGKGLIDLEDLKAYTSVWHQPIEGNYKGYHLLSMPPSSSGGIALLQILKMIEPYDLSKMGFHSADAVHLIVEAERRVYADRAEFLGDPAFFKVPVAGLIDTIYLQARMKDFDPSKASPSSTISHGQPPIKESEETTHFSIVDRWHNAVSSTTTLNMSYGSKIVVAGAGFFLNNEMDDFAVKPGVPNYYGLTGNEANAIAPGKRMLSCMTPTILEKDGSLFMVVGTPGGSTIITSVLQTIINVVDFQMDMQDAVSAKRFHHQWLPDQIDMEYGGLPSATVSRLSAWGHRFHTRKAIGRVDAILLTKKGKLRGGADPRGDDKAEAY